MTHISYAPGHLVFMRLWQDDILPTKGNTKGSATTRQTLHCLYFRSPPPLRCCDRRRRLSQLVEWSPFHRTAGG